MKKHLFLIIMIILPYHVIEAQEEDYPFTYGIGSFNITLLPEGQRKSTPDRLLGVSEEMKKECLPDGTYTNAVNVFMIENQEKTILVDAGFGNNLFAHLETCGKMPEDIGIILMTHMHGDHIGGLLKDGVKSFPNATLYISQAEYDYWMDDKAMQSVAENRRNGFIQARNVIDVYKDNLRLFTPGTLEKQEHEIIPGIKSIAAYGHTPGHTAFLIEDEGYQLLIWGDLTHAIPLQIPYPQVAYAADTYPDKSTESRRRIFEYISKNKEIWVAGMHIEHPGMGIVKGSPSAGYKFSLLCTCEGMLR